MKASGADGSGGKMVLRAVLLTSITVAALLFGLRGRAGPGVVMVLALFACFCGRHPLLKAYAFTAWVFTFVAASMFWPVAFGTWFGFDLKYLIVPLIQIIMFGMGTTLSLADFARVLVMPWPVFVGMTLQFSVMPLVGFTLAMTFGFPPEVAAGVVLIGSVSGGVASNLITYLAGGNVALSVTMTACSTVAAPIATPFLMKVLAGRLVPIHSLDLMFEILNMVVVPVVTGLIANRILYGQARHWNQRAPLASLALAGLALATVAAVLPTEAIGRLSALRTGLVLGSALLGAVAAVKLAMGLLRHGSGNWMDRVLPVVSMTGICFIIAIITARSRDKLLTVGPLLIAAAVLHNATGYFLGYWASRLLRLDEVVCRTVAIEVGMQNGGMASGLAMGVLNSPEAALAPAIFGPWMNISGSVLASWWRKRPPRAPARSGGNPTDNPTPPHEPT